MTILEKLIAFAAILLVGLDLAENKGWISLSSGWSLLLSVAIPVLLVAMLVLGSLNNRGTSATISPATNLCNLMLATGGIAVVLLLPKGHADGDYLWPASIAVVTIALAIIGYYFGKKYADEIGEARFDTMSNQQRDIPAAQCRED